LFRTTAARGHAMGTFTLKHERECLQMSLENSGEKRRWGRISQAIDYCGLSRTSLYTMASRNAGLFRKQGSATIVDFNVLDRILDAAPNADVNVPVRAADTS
jgi:hypothetical protein